MTALTTESREDLATAFSGLGLKVYGTVPAVPIPPCAVIVPDATWITPNRIGSTLAYRISWRIMVVIAPRKNDAATVDTENAIDAILAAMPAGYQIIRVGAPQLADTGAQGTVITTEITVQVDMKES